MADVFPHDGAPGMSSISPSGGQLRRLVLEDTQAVAALDIAIRGQEAWSGDAWRSFVTQGNGFGAFVGEALIAYAVFSCVCDEAELLFITTDQAHQQNGWATRTLTYSMNELQQQGIRRIFLEVHVNNTAAQRLYHAHGFLELHRRANYYRDGGSAIVMGYRNAAI